MRSQFILPDFFYLHAIFNLHHEILYAGMISIPACMISIPAGKLVEMKSKFIVTFFLFAYYI